jgi:catechol 2,3-dioxygenase-like lactoylglutathione lyase family enzyme
MSDAPLRLDHLALPVYDAAATHRFYSEVLQLPLVDALSGDDWGGRPWLMMFFGTGGTQLIALCALGGASRPGPDGLPADVRHYAFSVASRAEQGEWMARLRRHGVEYTEEDHGRQHSIYFSDPNDILLEVTTPPSASPPGTDPRAEQRVRHWIEAGSSGGAAPRA